MNKLSKGTVAVGAAVLLLLGGGGTLAYWNSTANITSADIAAGQLTATAPAGTWAVKHNGGSEQPIANIDNFVAVPGDQLIYSTTATITAEGTNLKFRATLGTGSITGATTGAADVALAARLTAGVTYTLETQESGITINNLLPSPTATINGLVGAEDTFDVVVKVTITWPFDQTGGTPADSPGKDNPAQNGNVSLSGLTLLVEQIPGS